MNDRVRALAVLGLPLIPADFDLEEAGSVRVEHRDDFLHAVRLSSAAVGPVTGGRVDQAVREIAVQVNAAQRSRRKGETAAHGLAPAGEEMR